MPTGGHAFVNTQRDYRGGQSGGQRWFRLLHAGVCSRECEI